MGCHFPSSGDLPDPGVQPAFPVSPALQADSLPDEPAGKPHYVARSLAKSKNDLSPYILKSITAQDVAVCFL